MFSFNLLNSYLMTSLVLNVVFFLCSHSLNTLEAFLKFVMGLYVLDLFEYPSYLTKYSLHPFFLLNLFNRIFSTSNSFLSSFEGFKVPFLWFYSFKDLSFLFSTLRVEILIAFWRESPWGLIYGKLFSLKSSF